VGAGGAPLACRLRAFGLFCLSSSSCGRGVTTDHRIAITETDVLIAWGGGFTISFLQVFLWYFGCHASTRTRVPELNAKLATALPGPVCSVASVVRRWQRGSQACQFFLGGGGGSPPPPLGVFEPRSLCKPFQLGDRLKLPVPVGWRTG